ncbi:MAG: cob(I)yrinic acid a,c-diamide adenosyltransferase [Bacteroidales bacterium]|nr:cob(I)yrinic acid a,c-diamide adenosyltransferase [Bacteroidales bacterium]
MKIYTKKGDDGTTSLVGGRRVLKCDSRVEAYGDADELISYLGVVRAHLLQYDSLAPMADEIFLIQQHLMDISAHLACDCEQDFLRPLKEEEWLAFLESSIDKMTALLPPKFSFIIPGPPAVAAECHVARTICRRCERKVVAIAAKMASDATCARYLNRLSDYLFALAQIVELQLSKKS